jgi:hypothetical protein
MFEDIRSRKSEERQYNDQLKRTKMVSKTLHRKLNIERHECH